MKKDLKAIKKILLFFLMIVIFYLMNVLSSLIIPLLLALFISLLLYPVLKFLVNKRVPGSLAVIITVLFPIPLLTGIGKAIQISAMNFYSNYGEIKDMFNQKLIHLGLDAALFDSKIQEFAADIKMADMISTVGSGVTSFLGITVTVILYIFFILAGLLNYKKYFQHIENQENGRWLEIFEEVKHSISIYVRVKFFISLAVGTGIYLACFFFGVRFGFFWGFLAFVLNFIPNIGSIIASGLCILFAFLYLSTVETIVFGLILGFWQQITGSFIEPKFLDAKLNISALVILLGLVFWGMILGVTGAFLSVPLMVLLKIIFEKTPGTESLARIMGH